jgi:hypothetical protein
MKVRPAVFANSFYPADAEELRHQVNYYLKQAKKANLPGKLKALIVPHAGYIYSGSIAAVGYKLLQHHIKGKTTILLIGPAHAFPIAGPKTANFSSWETPLGQTPAKALISIESNNAAHLQEHSLEVQLPFLQTICPQLTILPVVINQGQEKKLAQIISNLINQISFVIVSSDLSHYHSYNKAQQLDALANQAIPNLDITTVKNRVEACGKAGILTLMHLAQLQNWQGKLLDYRNSGDTVGDKSQVVGYGCYAFSSP